MILQGRIAEGDTVSVTAGDEGLIIAGEPVPAQPLEAAE
jgi:hypothetical protein